jgi:hypothetical protein
MIHFNMDPKEALEHMSADQKDALITIASRWRKVEVVGYPSGTMTPYVSLLVYGEGEGKMFLGVEPDGYTHS